jgi:hypothetical protein
VPKAAEITKVPNSSIATAANNGIQLQEFSAVNGFIFLWREDVHESKLGLSFKRNILYEERQQFSHASNVKCGNDQES